MLNSVEHEKSCISSGPGHYRIALSQMLSGDAFRSDLYRELAYTEVDRNNNVSVG